MDASVPGSVDLERLTAKESVVLDQDEDLIQGLPPQQMQWVEQVKHFLQRYMLYELCIHMYIAYTMQHAK